MGFISLPISIIDKSYWSAVLRILKAVSEVCRTKHVIGDFLRAQWLRICLLHLKPVFGTTQRDEGEGDEVGRGMRWGGGWEGG